MLNDPNAPTSGGVPYITGLPSIVRIPIPGTNGLCIELRPRGYIPTGGSTSTLFFQDAAGKRHLRLDYGYNIKTKTIDYHWNQVGTHTNFGINDHTSVGRVEKTVYKTAKYFRHAGRVLVVAGAAVDIVSVVTSSNPIRRASQVITSWALAWVGCKTLGTGAAAIGTLASPIGTAAGGIGGCLIGGYAGYRTGAAIGGTVYDWAHTAFSPLPEVSAL